jgi:hypothetical protein
MSLREQVLLRDATAERMFAGNELHLVKTVFGYQAGEWRTAGADEQARWRRYANDAVAAVQAASR